MNQLTIEKPPESPNLPAARFQLLALTLLLLAVVSARALDLKEAVIVVPPGVSGPEKMAAKMLAEEAEKRTATRWLESSTWPTSNVPVIFVGKRSDWEAIAPRGPQRPPTAKSPRAPEGYQLSVQRGGANPVVYILGNDARGVLFGVGRLLRELHLRRGGAVVDDNCEIESAPKYAIRGHQLGYRPKCNSYDAWDLPVWEQYFRDLAVFGCNSIELIPPRSDDDSTSPLFPRPPMEMMIGMSRLADSYGLDVWVWFPAMDADYSNAKTVETALREWAEIFEKVPRIDAVFVPGGDPGHTPPKALMALLEKQTANLRRYHPKGQMWVSPQGFTQAWLDEFLGILQRDQPAWLTGVVYGPQVRIGLPQFRQLVPAKYPIRHYPDITHNRQCQYPVSDWDVAYALTEARECINPRPEAEAAIFRRTQPDTAGFLSYSEGCNDDVNKIVWSALGWDPDLKVRDILQQFGRYFIGEDSGEEFAQGLLSLERNWQGPLLANQNVETTLAQFQDLEKSATPFQLRNWRFQQALFRAYYDGYVRRRLIWETDLEAQAMERLRSAAAVGASASMDAAEKILDRVNEEHVAQDWRTRILELGDALFQSIGMQLSVEKYKAIAVDRGASLDTLDYPLNNRPWLKERFAAIRKLPGEPERLAALEEILHWTDPGPGGFYDDLGNPARQPHLVQAFTFEQDPGRWQSARSGFEEDLIVDSPDESAGSARRVSWMDHAETLYDVPLQMHYTGLDPKSRYKLRVLYGGDNPKGKIRLVAGENVEIHPFMPKPVPFKPLEFVLPASTTAKGELTLSWTGEPGLGANGRRCQVSEVWLVKLPPLESK